jgi:hypothetical protein
VLVRHAPIAEVWRTRALCVACSVLHQHAMPVTPSPLVPRLVGRLLELMISSVEGVRARLHRPVVH